MCVGDIDLAIERIIDDDHRRFLSDLLYNFDDVDEIDAGLSELDEQWQRDDAALRISARRVVADIARRRAAQV